MKVPVIDTEDYILYLEELQDCLVIHCDIKTKWSKEVKRKLDVDFRRLMKECHKPVCALHTPNDKKHEKFLKMFDFEYLKQFQGTDGNNYDIYVWR